MGICKLCDENKKLIKSHIVPKGFFDFLYPDDAKKSKKYYLDIVSADNKYTKKSPIGIYDKNILCKECDNKLGVFDNYAQEIFLKRQVKQYPNSEEAFLIENVNCKMIRLFFISLLWRASISGREEFKLVNIGPFEKEIKEILRTRKTKNKDNFSIMICKFDNKNLPEITNKIIQSPFNQKIDSPHSIYKCNIVDKKF